MPETTTIPPEPPRAGVMVPWERVERFVGQVTHDVRNGLNALELQLTYLGEICTDPEAAAETKRLRTSLAAVTRQLQALRLATSAATPTRMDYPAGEFFEDLRERFERLENTRGASVTWQIELGAVALAVDPELTMAALLEIVGNSLRFGSVECAISARAVAGSMAFVTITERKPADASPIATVNWGHEPLQSGRRQGYGLGLFRAARIIEAQDGAISAEYRAPEHTLTTTITLPLAAAV